MNCMESNLKMHKSWFHKRYVRGSKLNFPKAYLFCFKLFRSTKNLSFLLGLVMGVCRELSGTLACFIILVSSRLQYKSSLR